MKIHQFLFLAFSCDALIHAQNLSVLGVPNLQKLNYSYTTEIEGSSNSSNGKCFYTLTVKYSQPLDFPVGTTDDCAPDVKASDGKYFLDFRWSFQRFSNATFKATGFNHLSLDFNSCGHPGFGFQTPHMDAHLYFVSPEYRMKYMVCDKITGTTVCKRESLQTGFGKMFYIYPKDSAGNYTDFPPGFEWDNTTAIQYMGTHGHDFTGEPTVPENWTEPVLFYTSFNGSLTAFEPMFPLSYTRGSMDKFDEYNITYSIQTTKTLPSYFSVAYDADLRLFVTKNLQGSSSRMKVQSLTNKPVLRFGWIWLWPQCLLFLVRLGLCEREFVRVKDFLFRVESVPNLEIGSYFFFKVWQPINERIISQFSTPIWKVLSLS